MTAVAWPTIGVMVTLGVFLWRALGARMDALTARVDALAVSVADVDRRLARLEGWIEGERAGWPRLPEPVGEAGEARA